MTLREKVDEYGGVRRAAAPDAYAANVGYLSRRNASVITYSKMFGEIGRISIPVEMVSG